MKLGNTVRLLSRPLVVLAESGITTVMHRLELRCAEWYSDKRLGPQRASQTISRESSQLMRS